MFRFKGQESGARPDVAKTIPYKGGALVLMLEEFKNEDGDTICKSAGLMKFMRGSQG
jgi:hypothetical protein